MSEETEKAKEQAAQAGHQAKAAAKSTGRAARDAAEPVIEAVADTAQDTAESVEDLADEAVSVARRLGYAGPELALAAFGLAVTVYSGKNALAKFQGYYDR